MSNNCLSGKFIIIHSCFSNIRLLGFCSKYGKEMFWVDVYNIPIPNGVEEENFPFSQTGPEN